VDQMATHSAPESPFDDPLADTIIRSSDDVDFRVYKIILEIASPVFKSMFPLPNASNPSSGAQVVTVDETARVIETLLRLCYPIAPTPIDDLDHFVAVSEAAKKYETAGTHVYLEKQLETLLNARGVDPLRAYAIACLYRYDGVVGAAAKRTALEVPRYLESRTMPPEFAHLPAAAVFSLMQYRRRCVEAAVAQVGDLEWMVHGKHAKKMLFWPTGKPILGKSWIWIACRETGDHSYTVSVKDTDFAVKTWYKWYLEDAAKVLEDHPKGAAVTRSSVLARAMEGAARCTLCAGAAWKDLVDYSQLLAERIDQAVANVSAASRLLVRHS
ncbi:hypothetical protein C8Q77DRAFT_1063731, partial [Trametes polyzona]